MDFASVFEIGLTDVLIIVFLICIVYRLLIRKTETPNPEVQPASLPPMPKRDFTVDELLEYNGTDNERILMAICDKVYDVTMGKQFYGPDGPYGKLAGHDATRALATMDVGLVKDQHDDISDLKDYELNEAKEWAERLSCMFYRHPYSINFLVSQKCLAT
ncbi:unnamed protein product [Anisakis simplex]|uniref:Cytochrome b5 heme-binding domain-containing protein n=1 Tax=Anisakis simplex TaxID=6269 RepID=A0A0M3J1Y7_ANISI|nr:unnamed protein product [Anisakis simplex]